MRYMGVGCATRISESLNPLHLTHWVGGIPSGFHMNHADYILIAGVGQIIIELIRFADGRGLAKWSCGLCGLKPWIAVMLQVPEMDVSIYDRQRCHVLIPLIRVAMAHCGLEEDSPLRTIALLNC